MVEAGRDGRRDLDGVGEVGQEEIGEPEPELSGKHRLDLKGQGLVGLAGDLGSGDHDEAEVGIVVRRRRRRR